MFTRYLSILFLAPALFAACSGGSATDAGGRGGASNGQPFYEMTCAQTACDECRDENSSACRECTGLCSRSSSSDCFTSCARICGGSCAACSREPECTKWRVTLPLPPLDRGVYDACLAQERACPSGSSSAESLCHYLARVMRPEAAEALSCIANNSCQPCSTAPSGTLDTELCDRQRACHGECPAGSRREDLLRPELVQGLRSCIAEPTCSKFDACVHAYDRLGALAFAGKDKVGDIFAIDGSPELHADDDKWYASCYDASSCGARFSCYQSCATCSPFCAIPCQTDADCVGQFVGSELAWQCFNFHDVYGGHCTVP
jgi:hypothetical protein